MSQQTNPRFQLFNFTDREIAIADLAFNMHSQHGQLPRIVPLQNAFAHIASLGCTTIVKQHTVQDPDFFAEYYAYYSRTFGAVDKHCHRLHFFSLAAEHNEEVLDFIDRAAASQSYLGFITIRPVRTSPMAATILCFPPDQHFLLSSDRFVVHIAGKTFSVHGTPFMQQDNAVGACAQASIWMALRTLRKREGNSAFDPAQITNAATRFMVRGRTLPNREGLSVDQMIEAIRFAGYSPHIIRFGSGPGKPLDADQFRTAKRKIYTYVESAMPVVLGVFPNANDGHAIVLIGHKWEANTNPTPYLVRDGLTLYHAADWVTTFITHNDNSGPYLDLPEQLVPGYAYCFDQINFAIPLLPNDVFMSGEEAEQVALIVLAGLLSPASSTGVTPAPKIEELVFRTYLMERSAFREWVINTPNMHPELRKYYRMKVLPKRIWISEISLLSEYNRANAGSLSRVGEFIIDPTGDFNDAPFLSIHLNISAILTFPAGIPAPFTDNSGVIIDRAANGSSIKYILLNGDTAYPPLCRR
ncbi:MAG: hypothetical protein V4443_00695 [Pseudomonadota bacterium]